MEAFHTTNQMYGKKWNCTTTDDPINKEEVPVYAEIGQREIELRNTMSKYKQQQLDSLKELYKQEEEIKKKQLAPVNGPIMTHVPPKNFPVKCEDIKYPQPTFDCGNPLYRSSNMNYGKFKPSGFEMPEKFYPRNTKFTTEFVGGNFINNGLVTGKTPSNVHRALDQ